ncbi:hypothetical protein ExPCM12_04297 [Escherichia coli]|nr:hypothetical protein ExPCM12_04297 [Escherichia coli]GCU97637.1 hypothetical protein HmCmsJML022_00724 [Escherichia coli]GDF31810.1 hypothetical protein HmCmsJML287_02459 [Escherichia coli]
MCNAVILNLLESLLISQYVCDVVAIQCCGIFTIVQQRSLKLAFFVGIYLPYLVPPCLRSELNALLLRLLHESITSLFIRQRHSQLFDLSIKLLRILLTFSNSIFPFQVKQSCFRIIQQITAYLTEVKRCLLSQSDIGTLFCLTKNINCLCPCPNKSITNTWLRKRLQAC